MRKNFKYIYGPVPSWRLGSSLGIDLLSTSEKACSFDCIYCQLGPTRAYTTKRKLYVPTRDVLKEIKMLPRVRIDYITFSGCGEPTLAINLGQAIRVVKRLRKEPVAVLTNSSLLYRKDVRRELALADMVAVKLDADSEKFLKAMNRPAKKIKFSAILKGIKHFREEYRGKLALQVMLTRENKAIVRNIARLAEFICPDEVQISTPVRPCAVKPLPRKNILALKKHFRGLSTITLYTVRRKKVRPVSAKDTMLRRGKTLE